MSSKPYLDVLIDAYAKGFLLDKSLPVLIAGLTEKYPEKVDGDRFIPLSENDSWVKYGSKAGRVLNPRAGATVSLGVGSFPLYALVADPQTVFLSFHCPDAYVRAFAKVVKDSELSLWLRDPDNWKTLAGKVGLLNDVAGAKTAFGRWQNVRSINQSTEPSVKSMETFYIGYPVASLSEVFSNLDRLFPVASVDAEKGKSQVFNGGLVHAALQDFILDIAASKAPSAEFRGSYDVGEVLVSCPESKVSEVVAAAGELYRRAYTKHLRGQYLPLTARMGRNLSEVSSEQKALQIWNV